jgi:hypothetical protein
MRGCGGCDVVDDGPRVVIGRVNLPPGSPPVADWHLHCWEQHRSGTIENKENDHG